MEYYNSAVIAGLLLLTPEIRYTSGSRAFAKFTVAVKRMYIDVFVWDSELARNCAKFLHEGSSVHVDGSLRTSIYNSKDGTGKKLATEISAEKIVFLDSAQGGLL